jgi:hypothetical protein
MAIDERKKFPHGSFRAWKSLKLTMPGKSWNISLKLIMPGKSWNMKCMYF